VSVEDRIQELKDRLRAVIDFYGKTDPSMEDHHLNVATEGGSTIYFALNGGNIDLAYSFLRVINDFLGREWDQGRCKHRAIRVAIIEFQDIAEQVSELIREGGK